MQSGKASLDFADRPVFAAVIQPHRSLDALCVAISANARSGRSFEQVVLTPFELLLRRVSHRGERREWRFNPLWTKLGRETDDEFGLQRLWLISRGEHVAIARELSPPERESFARALGSALVQVNRRF